MKKYYLASTGLNLIGLLFGSVAMAYPTIWKLSNDTNRRLRIACESTSVVGLARIQTPIVTVEPHKSFTLNWGTAWHNDGMGLNKASWRCHEEASRMVAVEGHFDTEWDESTLLLLRQDGDRLSIQRAEPKSPVAKSQRPEK